jgi:hypothetical protein
VVFANHITEAALVWFQRRSRPSLQLRRASQGGKLYEDFMPFLSIPWLPKYPIELSDESGADRGERVFEQD